MAVPYNFKAIEKKWNEHIEKTLQEESLPVVQMRNKILVMHDKRMKKKVQFSRDLYWDYGKDAVFMYEIFAEPEENDAMWDDGGIDGVYRFLGRVWRLMIESDRPVHDTLILRNHFIEEIQLRLEKGRPDTIVSSLMEFLKKYQEEKMCLEDQRTVLIMLAPLAPYLAEELWQYLNLGGSVFEQPWPSANQEVLSERIMDIPVQINGHVAGRLQLPADITEEAALKAARAYIQSKKKGTVEKELYIPRRIISFKIV